MVFDFHFWKHSILILGLAVVIMLLVGPGCATQRPSIDVSTWAGDSKNEGVSRAQDKKTVMCSDPAFDQMVCMSYEDLTKLYLVFSQCGSWDL